MVESTTIQHGEQRKITIVVKSTIPKPFEVTNASFQLFLNGKMESSGSLEVDEVKPIEYMLSALIKPKQACALYDLIFIYDIPPEHCIHTVNVRVL